LEAISSSNFISHFDHNRLVFFPFQIHQKIVELSSDERSSIDSNLSYNDTKYAQFNAYASKIVLSDGFIGNEKILAELKKLNRRHGFGLNEDQMLDIVEKAVKGILLLKKKRRTKMLEMKWKNFADFDVQNEPAAEDPELLRKLNANAATAESRMQNVLTRLIY
jgi:hypothetical protein